MVAIARNFSKGNESRELLSCGRTVSIGFEGISKSLKVFIEIPYMKSGFGDVRSSWEGNVRGYESVCSELQKSAPLEWTGFGELTLQ